MLHETAYFESFERAFEYYSVYGCNYGDVKDKIEMGEIHIGKPILKTGQKRYLDFTKGRYYIKD